MDNLPLECVANILSFLPIADVFVCRSVCGKWKEAADSVIRDHKTLIILVAQNNKRTTMREAIVLRQSESPVRSDDETPVSLMGCWRTQPNRRNAGEWKKRLEGMVRLEKGWPSVWLAGFHPALILGSLANPLKSLINAVIMRNASTLTKVYMMCNSLPFDHTPDTSSPRVWQSAGFVLRKADFCCSGGLSATGPSVCQTSRVG